MCLDSENNYKHGYNNDINNMYGNITYLCLFPLYDLDVSIVRLCVVKKKEYIKVEQIPPKEYPGNLKERNFQAREHINEISVIWIYYIHNMIVNKFDDLTFY